MVLEINFVYPIGHFEVMLAGLSLRGKDRGFPPVTIKLMWPLATFIGKVEKNITKRNS